MSVIAQTRACLLLLGLVCALAGCSTMEVPTVPLVGPCGEPIVPPNPRPRGKIAICPFEVSAPVGSEVVLLASVSGGNGCLLPGERVEWTVSKGGVGEIVGLGEQDGFNFLRNPYKVDGHYAVGYTSRRMYALRRGSPEPHDDVTVLRGQSWVSLSSPVEGTSYVTAYAPEVLAWDTHKDTATIHWIDAQWQFPPPAINPAGTRHVFTSVVTRHTDHCPLAGWIVRYEITGGPAAGFAPGGATVLEVPTDEAGQASVEIAQTGSEPGTNTVRIDVIRPADPASGRGQPLVVGSGSTQMTWSAPQIALRASGPAQAGVGSTIRYQFAVSNPGDIAAQNARVSSEIPAGAVFVSSTPPAQPRGTRLDWNLGTIGPQSQQVIELIVRVDRAGSLTQCASVNTAENLTAQDCATTTVLAAAATPPPVTTPPSGTGQPRPTQPAARVELDVRGPQQAQVGSQVTYEVTISNPTASTVRGLVIHDAFDAGFQHAASASPIDRDLGELAPGQSRTIGVTFRVTQPGRLCHRVTIYGTGIAEVSRELCLQAVAAGGSPPPSGLPIEPGTPGTPPAERTSLRVSKTGPQQGRVGELSLFVIEVVNTGRVPALNVRITDRYDLQFLDPKQATEGHRYIGNDMVWVIPELAVGASQKLGINCLGLQASRSACNRVIVTADNADEQRDEHCLEIQAAAGQPQPPATTPPELSVTVSDLNEGVPVGQTVGYLITVKNGRTEAAAVQLSLDYPASLEFQSADRNNPSGARPQAGRVQFDPLPRLAAGGQAQYVVRFRAARAGPSTVRAVVTAQDLAVPVTVQERTDIMAAP